jgi:uncharacterized protein (TIGR04376 family)
VGLIDDLNRFLENRLEEFIRNNPHLELQALLEQLQEQEKDTLRLIIDSQNQQKNLQDEILAIAQDIQRWHERAGKAQAAGRQDLAQAATERESELLRQGNQRWGQMEGIKQRISKAQELLRQISLRREEVQAKAKEAEAARTSQKAQQRSETSNWNQSSTRNIRSGPDPLEDKFRRWEMDDELEQLKRNLGR